MFRKLFKTALTDEEKKIVETAEEQYAKYMKASAIAKNKGLSKINRNNAKLLYQLLDIIYNHTK